MAAVVIKNDILYRSKARADFFIAQTVNSCSLSVTVR